MSDDLDRDQLIALMAEGLRVARGRDALDRAHGRVSEGASERYAAFAAHRIDRMPDADAQLRCAANLLRIAVDPPD